MQGLVQGGCAKGLCKGVVQGGCAGLCAICAGALWVCAEGCAGNSLIGNSFNETKSLCWVSANLPRDFALNRE